MKTRPLGQECDKRYSLFVMKPISLWPNYQDFQIFPKHLMWIRGYQITIPTSFNGFCFILYALKQSRLFCLPALQ